MNSNNYRKLTNKEFLNKLNIVDKDNLEIDESYEYIDQATALKALKLSNSEPLCSVYIPKLIERDKNRLINSYYVIHPTLHPDFNQPIIHLILKESGVRRLFWNRGVNPFTGQASDPLITYGINLSNCHFDSCFTIQNVHSARDISIAFFKFIIDTNDDDEFAIINCQFERVLVNNITKVTLGKASPLKCINIRELATDHLRVHNINVNSIKIISHERSSKTISISECKSNRIEISTGIIDAIHIFNVVSTIALNINSKTKELSIVGNLGFPTTKSYINSFTIDIPYSEVKITYIIQELEIDSLTLTGIINGNVLIKDCNIKKLYFEDLTNNGVLKVQNILNINEISFISSSLGKSEFINVDIHKNSKTQIINSNISDIVIMNTAFTKNLIAENLNDYKGIRDAFRQLKYASGKQGDRIQELKYEALEMAAYEKDRLTFKSFDEKIILFFNKVTNNHGQSWVRALMCLILITIPLFMVIKISFGYVFVWGWFSSEEFSQYLEFAFNPIHNFENVFKEDLSYNKSADGYARSWDILSKFFIGFLLFQMIRAFRKYVK